MKRDKQAEGELRRRMTSGIFKAMAASGKVKRADMRKDLAVHADTLNGYLDDHRWTLAGWVAACTYCGKTPAEVLALGAETAAEHLP